MYDVLLLNADYSPVRVVDWRRAVGLLLEEKVRLVADYPGMRIRSQRDSVPWPAVVTLTRYAGYRGKVRFNRQNVYARDDWSCQYCGLSPRARVRDILTLDHVVPRCRAVGGRVTLPWSGERVPVTGWENVVTACRDCNQTKADRTPAQAGMELARLPRRPTPWEGIQLLVSRRTVPEPWKDYLPQVA